MQKGRRTPPKQEQLITTATEAGPLTFQSLKNTIDELLYIEYPRHVLDVPARLTPMRLPERTPIERGVLDRFQPRKRAW